MSENIVDIIKRIPDLSAIEGCTEHQVLDAQNELQLIFPTEYVSYVREFGCIDFGSTEWTGLNIQGRLNTVDATRQEMSVNPNFPKGYFVLENLGIDAKKTIVNEKGEVYLLQYDNITPLAKSLTEYLEMCIKK